MLNIKQNIIPKILGKGMMIQLSNLPGEIFCLRKIDSLQTAKRAYNLWQSIFHYEPEETHEEVKDLYNCCFDNAKLTSLFVDVEVYQLYYLESIKLTYLNLDDKAKVVKEVIGIGGLYGAYDNPNCTNLAWFGINEGYRRLGVGERFLALLETIAYQQGYKMMQLYSRDNEFERPAHNFYKKQHYNMYEISTNPETLEVELHFRKDLERAPMYQRPIRTLA
jgi:ribosomal protein S18 acetylase RimI-like enzyme